MFTMTASEEARASSLHKRALIIDTLSAEPFVCSPAMLTWLDELVAREVPTAVGFRPEHNVSWGATVQGYRSWRDWPNITRTLVRRGTTDEDVLKLLGRQLPAHLSRRRRIGV